MKKFKLAILVGCFIGFVNVNAQETRVEVGENHRFVIQPETSWAVEDVSKDEDTTFVETGNFFGLTLGYEFLPLEGLYFGAETLYSLGKKRLTITSPESYGYYKLNSLQNRVESRCGYALPLGSSVALIPYIGMGNYYYETGRYFLDILYVPIGIHLNFAFDVLAMGLKCQQMRHAYFWQEDKEANIWSSRSHGYEISLPISFETDGKWDVALEPYYMQMTSFLQYYGARISAIMSF